MQTDTQMTSYSGRKDQRKTFSIRLEPKLYDLLKQLAESEYTSMNSFLNRLLSKKVPRESSFWYQKHYKKLLIRNLLKDRHLCIAGWLPLVYWNHFIPLGNGRPHNALGTLLRLNVFCTLADIILSSAQKGVFLSPIVIESVPFSSSFTSNILLEPA